MQNFVWFHAIQSQIELSQKIWKKRNSSIPYWAYMLRCAQIASLLYLMIHILNINFGAISSTENRDELIPKILKKDSDYSATCWAIFMKSRMTSIYVRIMVNIKFHEILFISSRSTLVTNFLSHTHRHTDRQTFSKNSQIVFRTSQNV